MSATRRELAVDARCWKTDDVPADPTRFDLRLGLELCGGGLTDLWWRYASFGGVADVELLGELIAGTVDCGAHEYNLIAQALNEMFLDHGIGTFPVGYSDELGLTTAGGFPAVDPNGDRTSVLVRFDARRASRRSRAIAREAAYLRDVALRLVDSSRQLRRQQPERRADLERRRAALATSDPT